MSPPGGKQRLLLHLLLKIVKFRFLISRNDTELSVRPQTEQRLVGTRCQVISGGKRKLSLKEMDPELLKKEMDSELLKFVCACQGAVDVDVVMCNLFPGASADMVLANKDHFVLHSSNGRQRVVAKTSLRLCRVRDCCGTCEQLHLCKYFLFTGLCQRRVCSFCHDLNIRYNQRLLKQHELEGLSRAQLSTLLLQSDISLLPPICYKYNTGNDEFGQCQSGTDCAKLHICKKYLNQDCSCSKNHNFYAPQHLKSLYDKGVPHSLISSLRSVYANNEVLRISMKRSSVAPNITCATNQVGANLDQRHVRGRERGGKKGRGGHKWNGANRGKQLQPPQPTASCSDLGKTDDLALQQELNSSNSDLSAAMKDTIAESSDKQNVQWRQRNRSRRGGKQGDWQHRSTMGSRGKEANLGNLWQQQQTASNDVLRRNDTLEVRERLNEGVNQQQDLTSPHSDVLVFVVGKDTNAKNDNGFNVELQQQHQGREKENGANLEKPLPQHQPASPDVLASSDALDVRERLNEGVHQQQYFNSLGGDVSAVGKCTNVENNSLNVEQRKWNKGTGDNKRIVVPSLQQQISTLSDDVAKVGILDLDSKDGLNKGDNQLQDLNSSKNNVSDVGKDIDMSSDQSKQQAEDLNQTTAVTGDNQQLHRSRSTADTSVAVSSKDGNNGAVQKKYEIPFKDKTEICMYYIKGYCKHENQCIKLHDKMPYRWQVQEGDRWTDLPHNETIEKDYCDPKNTHSSSIPLVDFYTMTCRQNAVRRLSTPNSLVKPDFIHTTEWLWYWQDEFGRWKLYGADSPGHGSADVSSSKLEQRFLDKDKTVDFTAGSQSYSLSFQDMIQTNKRYGTKKLVSRRPQFVSAEDVKTKKVRKPSNFTSVPDNWDKTQISQTGALRVALNRTSDEYQKVKALFCSTMHGFNIITIDRIQNKALWEVFQWQKNLMKNNNGGSDVTERQLFHGTDSNHVKAICDKNFDWRICGTHGTVYGKGSYFARDATYSHSYTGNTAVRTMFVSRVLVGSYTKGASSYVRPPSKDGGDVNFYDTCVDNVLNPSIFVVFEKYQIYPEYLIQYRSADPLDDFVYPAPASAPAPTPAKCVIA